MPATGFSSPLANMVAQRKRLGAIRQSIGLEGMVPQGSMAPVMPANAPPPAAVVGPQVQAMLGQHAGVPAQSMAPPAPPPQQAPQSAPSAPAQAPVAVQPAFKPVDLNGDGIPDQPPPEGQQLPGVEDPAHKQQMQQMVTQFLDQHAPQQQAMMDQQKQASAPPPSTIQTFKQAVGRLPTPEELLVLEAQSHLAQQLGHPPSDEEIHQFLAPKKKD